MDLYSDNTFFISFSFIKIFYSREICFRDYLDWMRRYFDSLKIHWVSFVVEILGLIARNIFIAIIGILILCFCGSARCLTVFAEEMILNPFIVEGYVSKFSPGLDFVQGIVYDGANSLFNFIFRLFHCQIVKKIPFIHYKNEYEFLELIHFIHLKNLIFLQNFQSSYHNFASYLLGIVLVHKCYNYLLKFEVLITLDYNHLNWINFIILKEIITFLLFFQHQKVWLHPRIF